MSRRVYISTKRRLALFVEHNGICHLCGGKIHVGEAWEVSHPIPLELGGTDDESNWRPAHAKCHARQTAEIDMPDIARMKRRRASHLGARAPSRNPLPCGKRSRFRKKITGEVVLR